MLRTSTLSNVVLAAAMSFACATSPSTPKAASSEIAQLDSARLQQQSVAVAYSGFRSGQRPGGAEPSNAQIVEDLHIISSEGGFKLIRLYDSGPVSKRVLEQIREQNLDIKVMLGAWLNAEVSNHEGCAWLNDPIPQPQLDQNKTENLAEVSRAIKLANEHSGTVVAINVGNEALVSWNDHMVTTDALIQYAKTVKAKVSVPVTTADNYVVWVEQGQKLMEVMDFAAVHTYPAWEEKTIEQGLTYTIENMQAVRDALPNTRLVIGEAGWPSIASEFGERASEPNQKRYFDELSAWAAAHNITTFMFEAFDEDWKGDDNPLGAEKHWGLFNIDRTPKLVMKDRK